MPVPSCLSWKLEVLGDEYLCILQQREEMFV